MKSKFALIFTTALLLCLSSAAVATSTKGQGIYMNFCASCHDRGSAGAPRVGDKVAWKSRSSKGAEALIANAVKGFQGSSGFMPAKGGNSALTDEEISSAVLYMLEFSK